MARGHEPLHDAPYSKATTQTIRTLQNHQRNIQSGLSIGTTAPMEDPQRVPRFPPIALSRNDNARAQLPRATPRRHRRGKGVGGKGNRGIETLRTMEEATILNTMGRVFGGAQLLGTGGRNTRTKSHTRLREPTKG